jgi:hypothetical protein
MSFEIRFIQHADEHRWHAVHRGAMLRFDDVERSGRIEADRGEHDSRAVCRTEQRAEDHAETVIHRQGDAQPIMFGKSHDLGRNLCVVDDIVMSKRGGLRRACRTTRKLDIDRVVEVQAGRYRVCPFHLIIIRECHDIIEIEHAG